MSRPINYCIILYIINLIFILDYLFHNNLNFLTFKSNDGIMSDIALSVFNAQGEINMNNKKHFERKDGKFEYEFDVIGHHAHKIRVQADNRKQAICRANDFLDLDNPDDSLYADFKTGKGAVAFRVKPAAVDVRFSGKFKLNYHPNSRNRQYPDNYHAED